MSSGRSSPLENTVERHASSTEAWMRIRLCIFQWTKNCGDIPRAANTLLRECTSWTPLDHSAYVSGGNSLAAAAQKHHDLGCLKERGGPSRGDLTCCNDPPAISPLAVQQGLDPHHAYVLLLCGTLAGYALLGKGFAYLGIAPLFIGEIALGLGLCIVSLRSGCRLAMLATVPGPPARRAAFTLVMYPSRCIRSQLRD